MLTVSSLFCLFLKNESDLYDARALADCNAVLVGSDAQNGLQWELIHDTEKCFPTCTHSTYCFLACWQVKFHPKSCGLKYPDNIQTAPQHNMACMGLILFF